MSKWVGWKLYLTKYDEQPLGKWCKFWSWGEHNFSLYFAKESKLGCILLPCDQTIEELYCLFWLRFSYINW